MKNPILPADQVITGAGGYATTGWWLFFESLASRVKDAVLGYASLTHAGRLPKVSTAGTLAESALTDDGTKVSSTERLQIDTGATPAEGQFFIQANGLGGFTGLVYAAGNINLGFDVKWTGTGWIATHAAVAVAVKNTTNLSFVGSTGNVVGGAATLNALAGLKLANGFLGVGGNLAPGYALDATGDVNASGVLRVAGTQVVGARLAAVTAPSISTSNTGSTAGATYTVTEQGMLNALKTAVTNLNNDVTSLQSSVNTLISRLSTHGLTS